MHRPKPGDKGKKPKPVKGPKIITGSNPRKRSRPLDRIAGEGSAAGTLRKHREALDSGNPRGTHPKPGRRK